jgi:hypothetical protein
MRPGVRRLGSELERMIRWSLAGKGQEGEDGAGA